MKNCAMTPEELSERLWEFAVRIAKVVEALPDTRMGRHIAGQLCRCGTSSAPNYDETVAAESRADFIHKLSVAWKEMRETRGWVRFIARLGMLPQKRMAPLIDEAEQLCRIVITISKTMRTTRRLEKHLPSTSPNFLNFQNCRTAMKLHRIL